MNVANRKLFANRDARKKLAEMGGILASSPELLGEAQKFAEAGQIDVQMYVINVPGLTAPGEYLKISEETLMQLNDIVPQLMSQQETLVEPAEAVEGLVNVRPGDALLPKRLRDIGAIPDQAPVPTVQEPIGQRIGDSMRSIMGPVADTLRGPTQSLAAAIEPPVQALGAAIEQGPELLSPELSDALSRRPGFRDYSIVTPDAQNPMVQMIESGLSTAGVEDPSTATMSDLPQVIDYIVSPKDEDRLPSTLPSTDFNLDPTQGYPFPMDAPSETSPSTDPMNLINVGPALTTSSTVDEIVEDATNRQEGFVPGGPGLAERQAGRFASGQPDPELMQMAGMPDDSDYLNGLTEQIFENPGDVSKFLAVNAEQTKKKRKGDEPTGTEGDATTDDKTDKILKMSTSEATNEYYKSLKELFGLSDEDKARDLSLTMAQFGFAMAAGQSPNALTNIANAAGAALAQMRQSQATEREREDKLKLLAYEQALDEQKEARELDRLLAKENRADKRELSLYISKLQAKAALDPDVKSYLETAEGKAALGIYKDIIGNELVDADEVVPSFIQQAGNLAPEFLTYLGLGAGTGGDETTGTGTTMGDIK